MKFYPKHDTKNKFTPIAMPKGLHLQNKSDLHQAILLSAL